MPRYTVKMTVEDLRSKIESTNSLLAEEDLDEISGYEVLGLTDTVERDLSKVKLDGENFSCGGDDPIDDKILGYQTLDNGMSFWGCTVAGDAGVPVVFIIYWDGKKLRGYIPDEGNTYNLKTKEPYGYMDDEEYESLIDQDKILQCIKDRILVKSQPPATTATSKVAATRVETLTFYGIGSESYELWRDMVETRHKLIGLGYNDRAKVLYEWIKEDAKESKKWYLEHWGKLNKKESATETFVMWS